MNKYHIHVTGWAYSMTCYGNSIKDAKANFREQHGFTRLPKGTSIWEA